MPPEDTVRRDTAFIAFKAYKETSKILHDKFEDDFGLNEQMFALMAVMADCAVYCEVPIELLITNLKMMYTAKIAANQIDDEEAANDTTH